MRHRGILPLADFFQISRLGRSHLRLDLHRLPNPSLSHETEDREAKEEAGLSMDTERDRDGDPEGAGMYFGKWVG